MPYSNVYVGRFAPSPSGPLHLGSLVCALATYLDAKQHNGKWLVRMEDIDPPREQPGAAQTILHSLQAHGLCWDNDVLFQSTRVSAYQNALDSLQQADLTYRCSCIRKRLLTLNGTYDGHCLTSPPQADAPCAVRLKTLATPNTITFTDGIRGDQTFYSKDHKDFIIRRKDGLFAYHIAVVVDDAYQKVTHVVRGADILDSTPKHLLLFKSLGWAAPGFAHIPLVLGDDGDKLSKQTHAPALDDTRPLENLLCTFTHLKIPPPNTPITNVQDCLRYALDQFQLKRLI